MPIDMEAIIERLSKLHLDHQDAAKRAGMSKQQWSNLIQRIRENGGEQVSITTLERMAAALKCSAGDLLKRPGRAKAVK